MRKQVTNKNRGRYLLSKQRPRRGDDGILPAPPRPRLRGVPTGRCPCGSGAGRSLTRAQPTPPSGCRGFESGHADKPKASHLNRREAFALGGLQGGRTHRDSAIVFCGIKNINIDISIFYFAKTEKMPFWQFTAPFGLQLRQIAF